MSSIEYYQNFKAENIIDEGRTIQLAIDKIQNWLNHNQFQPKLNNETIVTFLLSCDNKIDATIKTIQSHYKCKMNSPEIFNNRDIDSKELQIAINTVNVSSLPIRTDENDVIHFFKVNDTNYNNFDLIDIMKISYMILDVTHRNNPPNGLVVLIDMKGIGLMHLTRFKPNAIKKYFEFLQEGLPIKLKVIHLLNCVYFIDKLINLIKVFMKSELMDLLKFHSTGLDMNEFHKKYIPAKCLPKEYNGELPNVQLLNQKTIEQFRELKEFFLMEENQRKNNQTQ